MQRTIKFRAWIKENYYDDKPYMLHQVNAVEPNGDIQINSVLHETKGLYDCHSANEIELMQYTGLKDSHGNEVYEGDIIEAVFELLDDELKTVMDAGVVVFKDYGFQVQTFEDHYEPLHEWAQLSEELKVIGNRFENPELLEDNR